MVVILGKKRNMLQTIPKRFPSVKIPWIQKTKTKTKTKNKKQKTSFVFPVSFWTKAKIRSFPL